MEKFMVFADDMPIALAANCGEEVNDVGDG